MQSGTMDRRAPPPQPLAVVRHQTDLSSGAGRIPGDVPYPDCSGARVSTLVAVAAITLAADGDESAPRGGGGRPQPSPSPRRFVAARQRSTANSAWVAEAGRGRGPTRSAAYRERRPERFLPDSELKALAVVDAGARVTLAVPEAERERISLLYDARLRRTSSVRFRACSRSGEYPGPGGYGSRDQFNGGFFVRDAHCAAIEVWTEGSTSPIRFRLPFGVEVRSCEPGRAN